MGLKIINRYICKFIYIRIQRIWQGFVKSFARDFKTLCFTQYFTILRDHTKPVLLYYYELHHM